LTFTQQSLHLANTACVRGSAAEQNRLVAEIVRRARYAVKGAVAM